MIGALENIKVLDFTTVLPGQYATLMMADMGADVLKISSPSKKDVILEQEPYFEDSEISISQMWLLRNKNTMALNLKTKEAVNIVKELIKEYDVLIEGFKPGTMEKFGLSYDELKEINPSLIYCSLSSYGETGPMSSYAGHDINYLAKSGLMSISGKKDSGLSLLNAQIGGMSVGSNNAVIAILSAIIYRMNTNKGQRIDISMLDGLISYNTFEGLNYLYSGNIPSREESLLNGGSLYDFYETKDGRFFSVGAIEDKYFSGFCKIIGREDLISGGIFPENIEIVKKEIKEIFKSKDFNEWKQIFKDKDLCIEPVQNLEEALLLDEQIKERNVVVELDYNGNKVKQYKLPIEFSCSKAVYNHVGKKIGTDTEKILQKLSYSKEEINELKNKGVFK